MRDLTESRSHAKHGLITMQADMWCFPHVRYLLFSFTLQSLVYKMRESMKCRDIHKSWLVMGENRRVGIKKTTHVEIRHKKGGRVHHGE